VLHLLKSGDEVIAHADMYGGTNRFFHRVSAPYSNLSFKLIDMRVTANLESAISEKTKVRIALLARAHDSSTHRRSSSNSPESCLTECRW